MKVEVAGLVFMVIVAVGIAFFTFAFPEPNPKASMTISWTNNGPNRQTDRTAYGPFLPKNMLEKILPFSNFYAPQGNTWTMDYNHNLTVGCEASFSFMPPNGGGVFNISYILSDVDINGNPISSGGFLHKVTGSNKITGFNVSPISGSSGSISSSGIYENDMINVNYQNMIDRDVFSSSQTVYHIKLVVTATLIPNYSAPTAASNGALLTITCLTSNDVATIVINDITFIPLQIS